MTDLISRKAAIDSICRTVCDNPEICVSPCDEVKILRNMPSAQPEERTENTRKTHACDLIDRQAAISHVGDVPYIKDHPNVGLLWKAWIESLPSAQPEIVRCKDCMYWVAHDKRCVYLNHGFAPNMWCCHGRRADG